MFRAKSGWSTIRFLPSLRLGLRMATISRFAIFFALGAALTLLPAQTSSNSGSATTPPAAAPAKKDEKKPPPKPKPQPVKTPPAKAQPAKTPPAKYFEDQVELTDAAVHSKDKNAGVVIKELGNPKPYVVEASPSKTSILIYCEGETPDACDKALLEKIERDIIRLSGGPLEAAVELSVPHASSLGDLQKKVTSLNYSALEVQPVGPDKIRVSRNPASGVSLAEYQEQLKQFEKDLDHLAWQVEPQSPVARLFYIDAGPAAVALGGTAPSATKDDNLDPGPDSGAGGDDNAPSPNSADNSAPAAKKKAAGANASGGKKPGSGRPRPRPPPIRRPTNLLPTTRQPTPANRMVPIKPQSRRNRLQRPVIPRFPASRSSIPTSWCSPIRCREMTLPLQSANVFWRPSTFPGPR